MNFTVEVRPPTVSEVSASAKRTAAIMNATVDANGGRRVCRFEYGTTTGYGKEAQCGFDVGTPGLRTWMQFPASTRKECEFPLERAEPMFARAYRLSAGPPTSSAS